MDEGVCYGQLDEPLATSFEAERAAVLERSHACMPTAVFSSPLTRCMRLAESIADEHGLSARRDRRLLEMHFGAWQGRAWAEVPRHQLDQWSADFYHASPHGGESVAQFTVRVRQALGECQAASRRALVVTHAGVIRAALALTHRPDAWQQRIGYGQLITIDEDLAGEEFVAPTAR